MRLCVVLVVFLAAWAHGNGFPTYPHTSHITTYYGGTACAANKAVHAVGVMDDFCNIHDCAVYRNNSFQTVCDDFPPPIKFPILVRVFSDAACTTLRNVTGYATGTCIDLPASSVVAACRSDGKAAFFRYGAPMCKGQATNELYSSGACVSWGNGGSLRATCHE